MITNEITLKIQLYDILDPVCQRLLAPLLEEGLALTAAVGAPQVAATRAVVAAVLGAVITVPVTPYTRSSVKVDQRGTPAKIN